jgi:hypothetical protein
MQTMKIVFRREALVRAAEQQRGHAADNRLIHQQQLIVLTSLTPSSVK